MNKKRLAKFGLLAAFLISLSAAGKAEEQVEVLSTSPSGAFRIESRFPNQSADDATADIWVISTKDPDQRVKLPKQSADSPTDDEFHFSPNEEWLFATRHIGSGLRYGNIYHLLRPLRIEAVGEPGSFNDVVWATSVRLGALRTNYGALGFYAMTAFTNWSLDSSRLLIRLCGGEEKRNMLCGFLYFNTRTGKFELTDYSRRLGKGKAELLACAEPVDPLPGEEELKKRFDALDQQLNKKYAEVLAKTDKERVAGVRAAQRDWLKQRDAGEKFYVASFSAAEKSRRRLQFLGDVTASRIDTPADQWE
jgi:uncharacterized protein YecT (DUF1311 family)